MKVLIITSFLRNMMPYLGKYEKILKKQNIEYDIILWDREKTDKIRKFNNEYIFSEKCPLGGKKILKISSYIKYRKEILKILNTKQYDKIIIFNTLPAIAIFDILLKKYKGNYLFDYRDYTYEKYKIYRFLVNNIIKNSYRTMISSKGFFKFLNSSKKISITHNIDKNIDSEKVSFSLKNLKKVTIGYVGLIRYESENKILINKLQYSSKYILKYVGKSYFDCNIEKYCKDNKIKNVFFCGEYNNDEKNHIYKNIDMINAIYGSKSYEVITALPNRLYDCLILKKPIIVSDNTYLASVVKNNKIGIAIDLKKDKENIEKIIDEYIEKFNEEEFYNNTNILLKKILNEENEAINKIKSFIEDK